MAYARGRRIKTEFEKALEHATDLRGESVIRREKEKEEFDENMEFLRLQGKVPPTFYNPSEPYETEEEKRERRKKVKVGRVQF